MRTLCVVLVIAAAACSAQGERTGIVVSPDMAYTLPYDPYDPNGVTGTGMTLLQPPPGTVPVDFSPFPYGATREEADRAGRELVNPTTRDRASLARGKQLFEIYCAVCHGMEGRGDGPIIGRFPNPPSLLAERARTLPDGALFHVIARGQGIMASYAVQVRAADRWHVVNHIRTLQGVKP